MAHELNMSVTKYEQIKEKLIPKHLGVNKNQIIKKAIRKDLLMESPKQIIQKGKLKYLKPIGEIQTIMRHFDAKFSQKKIKAVQSLTKRKRMESSSNGDEYQLQKKMSYLINLPTIKIIQKEAEKYRYFMNIEEIKKKQAIKTRILQKFQDYMQSQLKGNAQLNRNKRLNTMN